VSHQGGPACAKPGSQKRIDGMIAADRTRTFDPQERGPEGDSHVDVPRLVAVLTWAQPTIPAMRICLGSALEVTVGRGVSRTNQRDERSIKVFTRG
jgi:hypothetical protein